MTTLLIFGLLIYLVSNIQWIDPKARGIAISILAVLGLVLWVLGVVFHAITVPEWLTR